MEDSDVQIARLLTQSFGLKHVVVGQLPRFEAEQRKNIATSFCADEHAWLVRAGEFLSASVDTIYDGIAGDVLSAGYFETRPRLDLYRAGRFRELAETLMKPDTEAIQHTLDPAFRVAHSDDVAREQLVHELERYADGANPTAMFFFWNRTRREVALSPFGVFSGVKTCFCPYLDHQLFDFLASLPTEMVMDKKLHSDTISAAHPRLAAIPYAVGRRRRAARAHDVQRPRRRVRGGHQAEPLGSHGSFDGTHAAFRSQLHVPEEPRVDRSAAASLFLPVG